MKLAIPVVGLGLGHGGRRFCLPPSLNLAICRESLLIASEFVEGQNQNVSLIGDLNLRMGSLTGDSNKNSRTRLWGTIEEMGFCWFSQMRVSGP